MTAGFSETIKNEAKERKLEFVGTLLGILGSSSLENMLARKGVVRDGDGVIRAGKGTNTAG